MADQCKVLVQTPFKDRNSGNGCVNLSRDLVEKKIVNDSTTPLATKIDKKDCKRYFSCAGSDIDTVNCLCISANLDVLPRMLSQISSKYPWCVHSSACRRLFL